MELTNSKRVLATASYVAIELNEHEYRRAEREPGRALPKLNFLRDVKLRPVDVNRALIDSLRDARLVETEARRLRQAAAQLTELCTLIADRERPLPNSVLAPKAAAIPPDVLIGLAHKIATFSDDYELNPKIAALEKMLKRAPVGRLHLERIEMFPIGIERGELVFTVPLAPGETITLSHKEWSTSSQEYERIVQDYFESYSERGVSEKTDASMSAENESKHASAFNFSSNVAGTFGQVTTSVTVGLHASSEDRAALKQTTQRTFEVTEKASARTRQEHKISVKLETKRGVEDSSFRTISNPFADKAVRIDYYRMMRKWRTHLLRYGLRLTFDLTLPVPGARFWALHKRIRELDLQIAEPFKFSLVPTAITDGNHPTLALEAGITLAYPPPFKIPLTQIKFVTSSPGHGGNEPFVFTPPAGYFVEPYVEGSAMWSGPHPSAPISFLPNVTRTPQPPTNPLANGGYLTFNGYSQGSEAQRLFPVMFTNVSILFELTAWAQRTPELFADWQNRSWAALREAAHAVYQAKVARLQAERDQLWMALAGKDTLTLRRMEREELIRLTLYWLIGIEFESMASDVSGIIKHIIAKEQRDAVDGSPGEQLQRMTEPEWTRAAQFGELVVKFFQQAIEWENLLFFLYPYFWGSDDVGREKFLFEHPDPTHREFLRAGYTRVVIPVRPGFEKDFTEFLDTGILSGAANSQYLTIAAETEAFARTNYAGIPPANPETHARPLLFPQQRKTWEIMQAVVRKIEDYAAANNGEYPPDLTTIGGPYVDAWGEPLVYTYPGSGNDYDLISLGADKKVGGEGLDADISAGAAASLVASWFDYTPSSGIDIEIDTKSDVIA
jgi:hypothetical protein